MLRPGHKSRASAKARSGPKRTSRRVLPGGSKNVLDDRLGYLRCHQPRRAGRPASCAFSTTALPGPTTTWARTGSLDTGSGRCTTGGCTASCGGAAGGSTGGSGVLSLAAAATGCTCMLAATASAGDGSSAVALGTTSTGCQAGGASVSRTGLSFCSHERSLFPPASFASPVSPAVTRPSCVSPACAAPSSRS